MYSKRRNILKRKNQAKKNPRARATYLRKLGPFDFDRTPMSVNQWVSNVLKGVDSVERDFKYKIKFAKRVLQQARKDQVDKAYRNDLNTLIKEIASLQKAIRQIREWS